MIMCKVIKGTIEKFTPTMAVSFYTPGTAHVWW